MLELLVSEQHLSPEQARNHPAANALTRAIGANTRLTLDVLELKVYPGDVFLLCSDGLYQELCVDVLGEALSLASPQEALDSLFENVLSGAARDNLTGVVVHS